VAATQHESGEQTVNKRVAEENVIGRLCKLILELGKLLAKASERVTARNRDDEESPEELLAAIHAKHAESLRAGRDLILWQRHELGDALSREWTIHLLARYGLARAVAIACSDRIHASLCPQDEDVEQVVAAMLVPAIRKCLSERRTGASFNQGWKETLPRWRNP
jgi:hypothetical protein